MAKEAISVSIALRTSGTEIAPSFPFIAAQLHSFLINRSIVVGDALDVPLLSSIGSLTVQRVVPAVGAGAVRVTTDTRIVVIPALTADNASETPVGDARKPHDVISLPLPQAASVGHDAPSMPTLPLAFWGIGSESLLLRPDESVAGLDKPLSLLLETILLPYTHPSHLRALGFAPSRGILLHGPPGTGKTTLIKTVASIAARAIPGLEVRVFSVNGSSLMSGVPGETEARLQGLFREAAAHAGAKATTEDDNSTAANDGPDISELITVTEPPGVGSTDSLGASPSAAAHGAAKSNGLSIVFLDEMDALCPQRHRGGASRVGREGSSNPITARLVATMLTLMDGIAHKTTSSSSVSRGRVVVIGATNRVEAIDTALRRPGRFDREVRIDIPDEEARLAILRLQLKGVPVAEEVTAEYTNASDGGASEGGYSCYLERLAKQCVGYVGADLQALVREAARRRVAAVVASSSSSSSPATIAPLTIEDFEAARLVITASALRGIATSFERTDWSEIGGMSDVIQRLRTGVEKPLMHPEVYRDAGIPPPRGVLLYGPPGNSKTTLVRALATSLHAAFYSLSGAEVYSPYVGEAERTIRTLFQRARETAPSLIFLDEIDALVGSRGIGSGAGGGGADVSTGILATLLTEMDGVTTVGGVTVVAATNRPKSLDPALLRPGRLELHVEVPLPASQRDREEILRVHTRKTALASDVDLAAVAADDNTGGWSGAQLANLCREAAMEALREALTAGDQGQNKQAGAPLAVEGVRARHFAAALNTLASRASH